MNVISAGLLADFNQTQIKLQEEVTSNITTLTSKVSEINEKIRSEIKEDNKTLSENYQQQLESFNKNYRQQFSLLNEAIRTQYSTVTEIINGKEQLLNNLIISEKNSRSEETDRILQQLARVQYYMWDDSGVYRNAFVALVDELELMVKNKATGTASYKLTLDQMLETLDKCAYLYPSDKDDVLKLLPQIPNLDLQIEEFKQKIVNKLENIEVKKFEHRFL